MMTRYEAYIDNRPLSGVDPSIYVTDIQEAAPNIRRQTANYPTGDGQRVLNIVRQSLRVTVRFEIHDADVRRRADICERVQAWAASGDILTVNTRPERRLRVTVEQQPVVTSALGWTQALTVVFSAYAVPFWEDAHETRVTITGNASAEARVPGMAGIDALLGATVENTGDTPITAVTLRAGSSVLTFTGLSVAKGGALEVVYDDDRLLSAKAGKSSVLSKRTPESDDDLCAPCGQRCAFSVQATGGAAKTTFHLRGWYM